MKNSKPIQLIAFDQEKSINQLFNFKELVVKDEAKQFLLSLKDQKFASISVVGKYRTGKSYLLNNVLLNKSEGFVVGPTINPCTKGLWIWNELQEFVIDKNKKETQNVLIIDTEGIGAYDSEENSDTKIFLLALLLSSFFIYNSVGSIDEKAINGLSLVINLGKHLQKGADKDLEELINQFPQFLWVVRDFSLILEDKKGNEISPKQYLENALKQQKGLSDQIESKNRIRRLIDGYFPDRDCFLLVRPTENEQDLQNLCNIPLDQLRIEFQDGVEKLRRKVNQKLKTKQFKGNDVNGESFSMMCELFVDAINNGRLPSVQTTWSNLCNLETRKHTQNAVQQYSKCMREMIESNPMIDKKILKQKNKEIREQIYQSFKQNIQGFEIEGSIDQLNADFDKCLKQVKTQNEDVILQKFDIECNNYDDLKQEIKTIEDIDELYVKIQSKFKETFPVFNDKIHQKLLDFNRQFYKQSFEIVEELNKHQYNIQNRLQIERMKEIQAQLDNLEYNHKNELINLQNQLQKYQENEFQIKFLYEDQLSCNKSLLEQINNQTNQQLIQDNQANQQLVELQDQIQNLNKVIMDQEQQIIQLSKLPQEIKQLQHVLDESRLKDSQDYKNNEQTIKNLTTHLEFQKREYKNQQKLYSENIKQLEIETQKYRETIKELGQKIIQQQNSQNNDNIIRIQQMESQNLILAQQIKQLESLLKEKNQITFEKDGILQEKDEIYYKKIEEKNDQILKLQQQLQEHNENQEYYDYIKNKQKLMQGVSQEEQKLNYLLNQAQQITCKICQSTTKGYEFPIHLNQCVKNYIIQHRLKILKMDVKFEMKGEMALYNIEIRYNRNFWNLLKPFDEFQEFVKNILQIYSEPPFKEMLFFSQKDRSNLSNHHHEFYETQRQKLKLLLEQILQSKQLFSEDIVWEFLQINENQYKFDSNIDSLDEDYESPQRRRIPNERNQDSSEFHIGTDHEISISSMRESKIKMTPKDFVQKSFALQTFKHIIQPKGTPNSNLRKLLSNTNTSQLQQKLNQMEKSQNYESN